MNRYLIFIISLLAMTACNNGKSNDKADKDKLPVGMVSNPRSATGMDTVAAAMKPTMDFSDTLHNFGAIHESEVVEHDFTFTNNGKTPLYIVSAYGSCGCTVPEYPKDAIAPGKSAIMKVTFNSAGKSGHQDKTVTIHANTVRSVHMLFIKADIEGKK